MRRKTMRKRYAQDWPEKKVKPARKLTERHPWMGELKCWLSQEAELRWWNHNIRPAAYRHR